MRLELADRLMQLVTTREATQLTGLSTATLREWTSRRALIPADMPPKSQGSPARYGWQTILLLRLAVTLRDRFHLELHAHRGLFTGLRLGLTRFSFMGLWGKALLLQGGDRWSLFEEADPTAVHEDGIVVRLQAHLEVISGGFSLASPGTSPGQLELFPAHPVNGSPTQASRTDLSDQPLAQRRKSV